MQRHSDRNRRGLINIINVTPFVDVMLVLLVVFMITSPMLLPSVSIELPNVSHKPNMEEDSAPIVVTVSKDNNIYIQDKHISLEDLVKTLGSMVKGGQHKQIFIRGDKDAAYGFVAKVMSNVKAAGFSKLAVVVDSGS